MRTSLPATDESPWADEVCFCNPSCMVCPGHAAEYPLRHLDQQRHCPHRRSALGGFPTSCVARVLQIVWRALVNVRVNAREQICER